MRGRGAFGYALLVSLITAATTCAALLAWRGFVVDSGEFIAPVVVTAVMVGAAGAVLRWLGSPAIATVGVQALVAVAMVSSELGGSPFPVGGAGAEIGRALDSALESSRTYVAPIGADVPSVAPLMIVGGVFFVLLVDFLACTLRRVPVAGLALLAIYSVPAGLTEGGPSWVAFLLAAIGFLAMLHLDNRDHLLRWGRSLGPGTSSPWTDNNPVADAIRVGAGRIGATATVFALFLPPLIPVLDLDLLGIGPGDGDDKIEIHNPRTDLRRDLERGDDIPLIKIHTDDPDPDYLRVADLNRFTGEEWSSGDRDVANQNTATGALPDPLGLSPDVPRRSYTYDFDATSTFQSSWLPTPFPATSVTADGEWRYDDDTIDFIAVPDDLDTENLDWTATGVELDYGTTGEFFADAAINAVDDEYLEVPGGLPTIVRDLAFSVTSGAASDYEAALLLQDFFRTSGGFEYSLRKAPDGAGGDAFGTFLDKTKRDGRVGYCEQFASAMAVMARMVGIPARVAVGFLEPEDLGNGDWEYSSHDLHAWPELYFEGAGWVGFEPTPQTRSGTAPDYTTVPVDRANQSASTSDSSANVPSRSFTDPNELSASDKPQQQQQDAGANQDDGIDWRAVLVRVAIGVLVLAVLVALMFAPRTLRRRVRRRRLEGSPEDVWDELRAAATDLALPWPPGRSPQQVGRVLVSHLGDRADTNRPERPRTGPDVDPEAAMALERLVAALELARYARPGSAGPSTGLADDARTCIASLEAGVNQRTALRARWLPRSLWQRPTRQQVSRDDDLVGV